MKFLAASLLLLSLTASAQTVIDGNVIRGQGFGFKNFVKNPFCEKNVANITLGGAGLNLKSRDSTEKTNGISSCVLTSSATNGGVAVDHYFQFDVNTLDSDVTGNCEAKAVFKSATAATDGFYFGVTSGSGVVLASVALTNETGWKDVSVNYPCGPNVIPLYFTAMENKTLNVGNVTFGKATNIGSVSQATLVGLVKVTGCANPWSTTATSTFTAMAAQTGCVYSTYGQAQAPSTNIDGFKFASLPPGDYVLEYEGTLATGATNSTAYFQFTDGVNTARETSTLYTAGGSLVSNGLRQSLSYTSPQSNVTFQINAFGVAGATNLVYGTTTNPGVFRLWYYPSQAQQAVRMNQQTLPTVTKFTSGSGTYTVPQGVSWIRVRMVGGGGGGGGQSGGGGSGGNTTWASTLLVANGGGGGSSETGGAGGTTSSTAGPIIVRAENGARGQSTGETATANTFLNGGQGGSSAFGGAGAGGAANAAATDAVANTGSGGGGGGGQSAGVAKAGGGAGGYIEAVIYPTAGQQFAYAVGALGTAGTGTAAGGAGSAGQIIVEENYGAQNAPILVGGLVSSSLGTERLEWANVTTICTTGSCAIADKSGPWLTSITWVSAGRYTVNFAAGQFSAPPFCKCESYNAGTGQPNCRGYSAPTTTTWDIYDYNTANGTAGNDSFGIMCFGHR